MSEGKKEILLGDCLELMKDIPNGSIDMILCDLPYGITACKWDTIIPFDKLWEQYERIIKPNGAIVLTASQPFTSALVMSNPDWFKYDWTWEKSHPTGFALCKKRPLKYKEDILVFSKSQTIYNPQMWEGKPNHGDNKYLKGLTNNAQSQPNLKAVKAKKDGIKYPKDIIKINSHNRADLLHPTQKPVALFEYLIKTYTNEGDLVLDNCAGSGTTAIACLNTNRQFIVMEKEQKYYDIILKRVGDFNKKFEQQTLFGNEM
jgi:site-specific DNA-methyltransferase (adenine-specific)